MTKATAPRVDVAYLPAEASEADYALVVDVLRASSTLAVALELGYKRVLCTDTIERALELRAPDRALAGERGARPVPGFDYGNSPEGLGPAGGRELVLCTTNGTPAIVAATRVAGVVLAGSLLNLEAVAAAIPAGASVQVICAGTDGRFSLDDAFVAGRFVQLLEGERTDAARVAGRLAEAYSDPAEALREASHARVLEATGQAGDIAYCARQSVLGVVPLVESVTDGVAVVVSGSASHKFKSMNYEESFN